MKGGKQNVFQLARLRNRQHEGSPGTGKEQPRHPDRGGGVHRLRGPGGGRPDRRRHRHGERRAVRPLGLPDRLQKGNIRRYGSDLYRCNQDHTSQADWTPAAAASLWSKIGDPTEEWPEWSQPVGAHDAYNAGAKVSHNGKHWTSDVASNVWEPGVYGWTEVTA